MNGSFAVACSLHEPYLFDTRDGRVLRCECCGRIQIEFRGLTLLVDADEFETLLGTTMEVLDDLEGRENGSWRLAAPTDAGEGSATFTTEELQALYELLAGAQAMRTLGERIGALVNGHRRERPPSSWRR